MINRRIAESIVNWKFVIGNEAQHHFGKTFTDALTKRHKQIYNFHLRFLF